MFLEKNFYCTIFLAHCHSRSIEILEIFVESYQDEILSSLRLDKLLVLNNHEEEFKILIRNCTLIDLSNCGIDEDHDILIHIANFCQKLQGANHLLR